MKNQDKEQLLAVIEKWLIKHGVTDPRVTISVNYPGVANSVVCAPSLSEDDPDLLSCILGRMPRSHGTRLRSILFNSSTEKVLGTVSDIKNAGVGNLMGRKLMGWAILISFLESAKQEGVIWTEAETHLKHCPGRLRLRYRAGHV